MTGQLEELIPSDPGPPIIKTAWQPCNHSLTRQSQNHAAAIFSI